MEYDWLNEQQKIKLAKAFDASTELIPFFKIMP
jgi:hypothetical protein